MSPMRATCFSLNLIEISNDNGVRDGPLCKQSFSEVPSLPDYADVSYTTLNFVVLASLFMTAKCAI